MPATGRRHFKLSRCYSGLGAAVVEAGDVAGVILSTAPFRQGDQTIAQQNYFSYLGNTCPA
jgi:hypothetical protein